MTSQSETTNSKVCSTVQYRTVHHSGLELTRAPLGVPRKRVPTSFDPGFRFEDCLSNKASSTSNTNPSTLWGVSFLVAPLLITDAELQECRAGVGLLRRVAQPGTRNCCPARPSVGDRISRHRPDRGAPDAPGGPSCAPRNAPSGGLQIAAGPFNIGKPTT